MTEQKLLAALKQLVDDIRIAGEQWEDSCDGPASKPAGFELLVSEEAWNAAHAAIREAEGRESTPSDETLFLWAIGEAPEGFEWWKIAPEERPAWAKRVLEWENKR